MSRKPIQASDEELLALHYDALKENSTMPRTPPQSSEDLEESRDDGEEDEEGEDDEESSTKHADTTPPPEVAATPNPSFKRRKHRRTKGATGGVQDASMGAPPAEMWPTDADSVWEKILTEMPQDRGANEIYITVERFGLGQYQGEPINMGQIEGGAVVGGESISPGQSLMDYMVEVIHSRAPGPAKYRLDFKWKRGGRIKMGELRLASPNEIAQTRAAAMYRQQAQAQQGVGQPMPMRYPHGFGAMPPSYAPPLAQSGYAGPPYYPPPPNDGTRENVEGLRREISVMLGQINEMTRREAEMRGAPPPPLIAAPPPPSVEAEDARIARTVIGVLQGLGIKPQTGAIGMGQPAVQQQPVGFGSIIDRTKEQLGSLRELVKIFREVDGIKEAMGVPTGGADEEEVVQAPNPIVEGADRPAFGVREIPLSNFRGKKVLWADRQEDESLFTEWLPKMAAANPEMAAAFLEAGLRVLDQGAVGGLIRAFAQQGGAPAAAAAEVVGRVENGMGAVPQRPGGIPAP